MASMARRILLLFLVSFSLATAVDLKESCSTTRYPELCVSVLSANPASKTADTRGLALIAIRTAAKMAEDAKAAVEAEIEANIDEKTMNAAGREEEKDTQASRDYKCFCDCIIPIDIAIEKLYGTDDDTTFKSARYYFQADPGNWDWTCDRCHIAGTPKLPSIISKESEFDKFMKVTWKLVMQAPSGIIPSPPPNEFANGTD